MNPSATGIGLRGTQGMKAPRGQQFVSNYTPQQQQLFENQFAHAAPDSMTGRLASGDQSMFAELEAPALKQFAGLQGNIASRFSGQGMGGRQSSGFQNTMGAEASNFAEKLQSQRMGLQRQAIQDLMGMSNQLLGQEPYHTEEEELPWWKKALGALAPVAGAAAGSFLGPLGTAAGGALGNYFTNKMSGGGRKMDQGSGLASQGANLGGWR